MPIVQLINPIPRESLSMEGELRNFILRVNNQLINKHFKYFFFKMFEFFKKKIIDYKKEGIDGWRFVEHLDFFEEEKGPCV